jgi:hypothetical protein
MFRYKVPFYANTSDNTHCYQAALRSVLKYFLQDKEFSWRKLDKLTAKLEGMWSWQMQGLINLKKMGFEVLNFEDFDYEKFIKDGKKYLTERFGDEIADTAEKFSDLAQERRISKDFIKLFGKNFNLPDIDDIKKLLKRGYLVVCNLNQAILNGKKGWNGHFVMIFGYDDKNFYLHDPGFPPRKDRKVAFNKFLSAWAYPDKRSKNLIALKYSS